MLSLLKLPTDQAFCVLGYFNEIIAQYEKIGSKQRSKKQVEEFRVTPEIKNFFDLGWKEEK